MRFILSLIIVVLIITYVVLPLIPTVKSLFNNFITRVDESLTSNNKKEKSEEKK